MSGPTEVYKAHSSFHHPSPVDHNAKFVLTPGAPASNECRVLVVIARDNAIKPDQVCKGVVLRAGSCLYQRRFSSPCHP